MRLYLVQHGESKSKEEDPDRPLTDAGRADVAAVAAFLAAQPEIRLGRILHSGKTRARQTAEILGERLSVREGVEAADGLDPLADAGVWAARLGGLEEDLMLVGHLPHLSRLASLLLCGDADRELVRFRQGGVVSLGRDEALAWSVRWMVVPELVRAAG